MAAEPVTSLDESDDDLQSLEKEVIADSLNVRITDGRSLEDDVQSPAGSVHVASPPKVTPTCGILKGGVSELRKFLQEIVSCERGIGILLDTAPLYPCVEDGTSHYRYGKEYTQETPVLKQGKVFLCQDCGSGRLFVLKKFAKGQRLHGSEFMLKERESSHFPNIWGASKDETAVCIYSEYIAGGSLCMSQAWLPENIYRLAVSLLKGVAYMHSLPAVHYDIKPGNLALKDPTNPGSVVIIDLDSIHSPEIPFRKEGGTSHFRSPWHEELVAKARGNKGFHKDLVLVDLWAVNCVIISLWHGRTVWFEHHLRISKHQHKNLTVPCSCQTCLGLLGKVISSEWKKIVPTHLSHILRDSSDKTIQLLLRLLQYFLECFIQEGIEKSAQRALQILSGRVEDTLPPATVQEDNGIIVLH